MQDHADVLGCSTQVLELPKQKKNILQRAGTPGALNVRAKVLLNVVAVEASAAKDDGAIDAEFADDADEVVALHALDDLRDGLGQQRPTGRGGDQSSGVLGARGLEPRSDVFI